jgi:hypothetical protein
MDLYQQHEPMPEDQVPPMDDAIKDFSEQLAELRIEISKTSEQVNSSHAEELNPPQGPVALQKNFNGGLWQNVRIMLREYFTAGGIFNFRNGI